MTAADLHTWGVLVPYTMIATALWGLGAGAVRDGVAVGLVAPHTGGLPTVPLAYAGGLVAVAFIYACVSDRLAMRAAIGADPHAGHDLTALWVLAVLSWASVTVVVAGYVPLRRGTAHVLDRSARTDEAEHRAEEAEADAVTRAREQARLVMEYAEGIGVPMAAYDLHADRFLAMNAAGRRVYGDGDPEGPPGLYDRPYFEFLAPGEIGRAADLAESRRAAIADGHPDPGYHGLRLKLSNGRSVEFYQEERPGGLVGLLTFRDVTAEVAAERARADDLAARIASAELRAAHDALGRRIDAGADE